MKRGSALPIDAAGHRMEMYVPTTQHHTTAQQPETQNTPASTYVLLPFFVFFFLCVLICSPVTNFTSYTAAAAQRQS